MHHRSASNLHEIKSMLPESLEPIKGAKPRLSKMKSSCECLDGENFWLQERAMTSKNGFDLQAHIKRVSFVSKKKTREHGWDEASLKKKKIRVKNLKPILASSHLLCKKFESTGILKSASTANLKSMESIHTSDQAS